MQALRAAADRLQQHAAFMIHSDPDDARRLLELRRKQQEVIDATESELIDMALLE